MRTYTITKENRVTNSPFTIEGSNMKLDITHELPVPAETVCITPEGQQRAIRFISGCDTIFIDEQVKLGFPLKRKPTATERAMLTFIGGMNTIPDGYGNLEKYFEMAPWFVGTPEQERTKRRPPNSRKIYEIYDQEKIDTDNLNFEEFVTEARMIVNKGDKDTLVSLLRLSRPGGVVDPNISIRQLKLQLLELANTNPDFILKNVTTVKNDRMVIVSKGIDYGILNIEAAGWVRMLNSVTGKYDDVARIPDFGGRSAKLERTVAFFESQPGQTTFSELKNRIAEFERASNYLGVEEASGSKEPEPVKAEAVSEANNSIT